jgi:hypothetical protein
VTALSEAGVSKNGSTNGAHGTAAVDAASAPHGTNGNGAKTYGEVIPPGRQPTLFTKVLSWTSMNDGARTNSGVQDSHDGLYAPRTQDRRKSERRELPQLVAYYWDGGTSHAHDIRNISSTGLYLLTDIRWYLGTQVMISLQRSDVTAGDPHRSITINARVVRFGTDGLGFAFVMPEKKAATRPGSHSHRAASFTRQTPESVGIKGADRASFHSFLQELSRDQNAS